MEINVADFWITNRNNTSFCNKIAVITPSGQVPFGEIFKKAEAIAAYLIEDLQITGCPVVVFLPKSVDLIVSDMAIIYSGNIYSNIDIMQPVGRIDSILQQLQPIAIISIRQYHKMLDEVCVKGIKIIYLDELQFNDTNDFGIIEKCLHSVVDTDPLCIINTSGSTGIPKGVVLNHRSTIDFMHQAESALQIRDVRRIGSLSPAFFDIFTFEFLLMLWKGSTFVIIPPTIASFPNSIVEFLEKYQIDFIFWVPTVMVNIANRNALDSHHLPELKMILFAGEVFPVKQLSYWMNHLRGATFVNMYGPIEITVDCLYHIVTVDDINNDCVPIGKPFLNTRAIILNENNKECSENEQGELCIAGSCLALGYYNNPSKTGTVFVRNPLKTNYPEIIYRTGDIVYRRLDGNIIFVGRKDFQIKHLGYRIELGEIEHAAMKIPTINNACVLYEHDEKMIVLFYESTQRMDRIEIRNELSKLLPKYMLPSEYRYLSEMPRNPNGKIDRQLLKRNLSELLEDNAV